MTDMNYVFIPNAVLLLMLGLYTWRQNRGRLSGFYLVTNVAIALWVLCFLLLHEFQAFIPVNAVSRLQLISALVFANGFLAISVSYPDPSRMPRRALQGLNALVVATFCGLILFSDYVSRAQLQDGLVVFVDGPGYLLYTVYVASVGSATVVNLLISFVRYPEHRARVGYMLAGIFLFLVFAVIFHVILVLMGNYELLVVGHLGSIFPSLFFAYAFTKHDLLDIRMVVERSTSKFIVVTLAVSSVYFAWQFTPTGNAWSLALICLIAALWALYAARLELVLVTTARRRFVRGWYDAEDILSRLSTRLETERNRQDIFRVLSIEIDATFELEQAHCIVASRLPDDSLRGYQLLAADGTTLLAELAIADDFIEACQGRTEPVSLAEFSPAIQRRFATLGHARPEAALVVVFRSPEILEGILILGERSNQEAFSRKDKQFLQRLVRYVSAILYRLTPFEKLEKLYFDNQRRLHQAEIQLVRSEKTRAIAHATRQAHHEIRTPLSIIGMAARRIRDEQSAEKYRQVIAEQIERAMEIVNETLVITDVNDDTQDRTQPVDLNPILQRCVRLQPDGPHQQKLDLQAGLPAVAGIPGELQVLFSNLVKNALEAMPAGGVLSVRSRAVGEEVEVSVEDTGAGIAPELREKIWEPYFSGKLTSAGNSTAGRGWGLTICNRITTEHKGTIAFESRVGQGTRFTVRLPALTAISDVPVSSADPVL
jgi:signal transduction histidine kinase